VTKFRSAKALWISLEMYQLHVGAKPGHIFFWHPVCHMNKSSSTGANWEL